MANQNLGIPQYPMVNGGYVPVRGGYELALATQQPSILAQGQTVQGLQNQWLQQLSQGMKERAAAGVGVQVTPTTSNIWQNMGAAINDAPLALPAPSEKALNAHRVHNEKLAEAAAKGRNIGYTIDGKQYLATRGGEIEFTENGKTVKMDANGNPVKTSVTEVPSGKSPVGTETPAQAGKEQAPKVAGGDTSVPTGNEEAPKGTKKHKNTGNKEKWSGLKFQEGSGKGPQPGDYAGVHVDQKAHNKKQAEYDKMFADLDKADKEGRKAAVEANKGKKSGVVGAEAKAQKQRIADLEKEIADLKKNAGKEGTNLKEYKQRFRKFKKADNINKLKKFGKWAGIAAAVGIIGTAIWALCKNKKDDAVAEETPVVTTPPATEEDTTTVVTTPPAEETPVVTTPPTEETPEEETTPANLKYTVKKGDNIWNIAKAQLEVELGRTPTLREIKNRETTIMKNNPELKWEDDNYRVIIQPGQVINIAA